MAALGSLPITGWIEILKEFEYTSKRLQEICAKYEQQGDGQQMSKSKKDAPKRRITGYQIFSTETRAQMKLQYPKANDKKIRQLLKQTWQTLSDVTQQEWNQRAIDEKKNFTSN